MLSHVKYRNSNFTRMDKNVKKLTDIRTILVRQTIWGVKKVIMEPHSVTQAAVQWCGLGSL